MATGGGEPDPDTCAVCLGNFNSPKFLPCYHTFCAHCLQDLADRHHWGDFPCPACRRMTSLPAGGAASLQTNFYVKSQPSHQQMCRVHPKKELEFYCTVCDVTICLNCKLIDHEQHKIEDLSFAASQKREELQPHQQRLQRAESDATKRVTSLIEEKEFIKKKRAAVEKEIHKRHAALVAAADRKRDEELRSLQCQHADRDRDVDHAIEQQQGHKAQISQLLQQLNTAMTSGTASDVIYVAKEMRSGRGSQQVLDALTSQETKPIYRPVLRYNVSTDVMVQTTRDYVGSVCEMEMKEMGPEVKVTECFQCAQDPDVEVFSLCHVDRDPPVVYVSYERCGMKEDAPMKGFTETGQCVFTGTGNEVGKRSSKRFAQGRTMGITQSADLRATHRKSPTAAHLKLKNRLSGKGNIQRVTVTSTNPFKTETKTEFSIQVGPHRAFDVDNTEQYFAVVEEAQESTSGRSVRLYRRSVEKAVSTYSPPTGQYQPSDVCFYSLGGQKVLLITDQLNDAIHVVSIQGDSMKFERYLCAGCPSLVSPQAIAVDIQQRLWVACGGGSVLMMEKL